jgi:predicted TIM-barrel fold metal-dependent hydrolase
MPWTPEKSLQAMDTMNIDFAILSLPAISSGSIDEENRSIARKRNEFVAGICSTYPDRFGFFATPPFLDDIEGGWYNFCFFVTLE